MKLAAVVAVVAQYRPTAWGWYYLSVLGLLILAPEFYWIAVNSRNTITAQIRGLEAVNPAHPLDFATWTPLHWLIAISLNAFLVWLDVHLVGGIWG